MTAAAARERLNVQLAVDRHERRAVSNATSLSKAVPGTDVYELLTGGVMPGQVSVTERTAMCVGAVFSSVGLIGGAVAGMPFNLFTRTPAGRDPYESDLWWLFNESPWPNWTSASAWEFALMSVLLQGDGFKRIHRASPTSSRIIGFEPLHPLAVDVRRIDKRNVYVYADEDGVIQAVDQDDMLHFAGVGFNGLRSLTPIRYALKKSAGIALAADEFAQQSLSGGSRSDLFLSTTGKVDEKQRDQIRARWDAEHLGIQNAKYPIVLSGDWKVEEIGLNAEDMQLLSTRQFQVEDIARVFGVPPHMIGKTDASTSWGSGIENMGIGFVTYTLRRHLTRIAQEINRKCWPRSLKVFGEFNTDALMAGDSKAQAEYFSKALGGPGTQGWMTVNEVRKLKNQPPMDGWNEIVKAGSKPNADASTGAAAGQ